jgi:hypothetical protein
MTIKVTAQEKGYMLQIISGGCPYHSIDPRFASWHEAQNKLSRLINGLPIKKK